MANDQNKVRPNYGPPPKGKAQIMNQGQTEATAWGANPNATGKIPEPRNYPDL